MSEKLNTAPAVIGIDIGKNSFHIVGQDQHGAIVLRQKWSRGQVETRLANLRDAEAIAEAVQRPTMKFVATKTADQLDLQALHRVRERMVGQRTGIINQIRAFLLERGIAVRQSLRSLRGALPSILATRDDVLAPACRASSKTWQETGAGWMSASRASRARLKRSLVEIRPARD
jgi:transposase